MDQQLITRTRKTFDRALRALPVTQHYRIWPLYLDFLQLHSIPETAIRVYRRYMKVKHLAMINNQRSSNFVKILASPSYLTSVVFDEQNSNQLKALLRSIRRSSLIFRENFENERKLLG